MKDLQISVGRFVREAEFRKGTPRRSIEKNVLAPGQCLVVGKEIVAVTFVDSIVRRGNTHSTNGAIPADDSFMLTSSVPGYREMPATDGAIAAEVVDGATQDVVGNEPTASAVENIEAVESEEAAEDEETIEGLDAVDINPDEAVEAEDLATQPVEQAYPATSQELDDGASRPESDELAYSNSHELDDGASRPESAEFADPEQTEVETNPTQAAADERFKHPPRPVTHRPRKSRKMFKAIGLRPSRSIASSLPVTRVADRAITRGQVPGMHATQTRVADQTITRGQVPGMHATQTVMYGAPLQQGGAPKLALVQQPEPAQQAASAAQQAPSAPSQNRYRWRRSWHELEAQRARENELDFDDVLAEYGIFPGDPGDSIGFRPCSVDNPYPGAPKPSASAQVDSDTTPSDPGVAAIGDVLRDFAQCNRKLLETNQQLQSALLEGQRTTTPPSQSQASSPPKAATDNRALVYEVASAIIYLADFVVNGGLTT